MYQPSLCRVETLKNISFLKDETKRAKEVAQKNDNEGCL